MTGNAARPDAVQSIQFRDIALDTQKLSHVMQLVLVTKPGLDQAHLVERAKHDRVNDAIASHFQSAIQIGQC